MGWRERDWARFTEDERRRYYGSSPPGACVPVTSAVLKTVVLSAVIAILGGNAHFGWVRLHLPNSSRLAATHVIYGERGTTPGSLLVRGGAETACTETERSLGGTWTCLAWTLAVNGEPIVPATPYSGNCAHLVVDQARGAWTCVTPTA